MTYWKSPHRSIAADFRIFFVRGLAVLLPSVLTIWIVVAAYRFVETTIAEPVNRVTRVLVIRTVPYVVPEAGQQRLPWYVVTAEDMEAENQRRVAEGRRQLHPVEDRARLEHETRVRAFRAWWEQHAWLNAIGLIVAIVAIYLAGRTFGSFVGRRITLRFERFLAGVPVFKQVYPYMKQIVEFVFGEQTIEFNRVVLIEYPRRGIWSIGFLTGHSMNDIAFAAGAQPVEMVTVFIPSSPTPFTGYTVTLPRREVMDLKISVEEALRFTVSGGVLVPDHQALGAVANGAVLPSGQAPARRVDVIEDAEPTDRNPHATVDQSRSPAEHRGDRPEPRPSSRESQTRK